VREAICADGGVLREVYKDLGWGQIVLRTIPPGMCTEPHRHSRTEEVWVLARGELAVDLEGVGEVRMREWDALPLPAGTGHAVRNDGGEEAVLLFWASRLYDPEDPDRELWT